MQLPISQAPPIPEISRDELLKRLHDPTLTIVDVLPSVAYEEQHIAGAISLPVAEIAAHARELLPDRSKAIAVYCGGFE